jgi:hypothetical protein
MRIQVRYLPEKTIESDAEALLAEFAQEYSVTLRAPIPIDEIVEKHLKLTIDFDDLRRVLDLPPVTGPEPDVLGALWVDRREIFIDQRLDPEKHPRMEGRYRFTLGHEAGGHWRLHRPYLALDVGQMALFEGRSKPSVICRSSQAKEPIEWQADFYSSCLLMPRAMVLDAWRERFGDANPQFLLLENRIALLSDDDDEITDELIRPFAEKFKVSMEAMRIRLERLGLLHREVPRQRSLAVGL